MRFSVIAFVLIFFVWGVLVLLKFSCFPVARQQTCRPRDKNYMILQWKVYGKWTSTFCVKTDNVCAPPKLQQNEHTPGVVLSFLVIFIQFNDSCKFHNFSKQIGEALKTCDRTPTSTGKVRSFQGILNGKPAVSYNRVFHDRHFKGVCQIFCQIFCHIGWQKAWLWFNDIFTDFTYWIIIISIIYCALHWVYPQLS